MGSFPIILFIIIIFFMGKDFMSDGKLHIKAKIVHGIIMLLLCYSYTGSFSEVFWFARNTDNYEATFGQTGIFSGSTFGWIRFAASIVSTVALFTFFSMSSRRDGARRFALKLFPLMGLFGSFSFYRGLVFEEGNSLISTHWGFFILSLVVSIAFFMGLFFIYRSKMMLRFFERDGVIGEATEEELNEKIDEMGR